MLFIIHPHRPGINSSRKTCHFGCELKIVKGFTTTLISIGADTPKPTFLWQPDALDVVCHLLITFRDMSVEAVPVTVISSRFDIFALGAELAEHDPHSNAAMISRCHTVAMDMCKTVPR